MSSTQNRPARCNMHFVPGFTFEGYCYERSPALLAQLRDEAKRKLAAMHSSECQLSGLANASDSETPPSVEGA
jgi:hypothetical protein